MENSSRYEKSGMNNVIVINYEEGQIEVPVENTDYFHVKWEYDSKTKKMLAKIIPMVPKDLNSTVKGKIGELIGKVVLEFMHKRIMELQDSNCEFDILDSEGRIRYDIKFSLPHSDEGHASFWKFCLKGDRAPKDYEEDVDYLLLIGTYNDTKLEPAFYIISSNCNEVKEYSEIRIPTSGKGLYEKYRQYPFHTEG